LSADSVPIDNLINVLVSKIFFLIITGGNSYDEKDFNGDGINGFNKKKKKKRRHG
jgi:hypothetical protein